MWKMQKNNNLMDHFNKVKMLVEQFACLEAPMHEEDIVMTLLKSLLALYEYDHCFAHDVDEEVDDGVRDDKFDAQDVKTQGKIAPRRRRSDSITSK